MKKLEIPRLEKTAYIRHLNHKNGITILQYRRKLIDSLSERVVNIHTYVYALSKINKK